MIKNKKRYRHAQLYCNKFSMIAKHLILVVTIGYNCFAFSQKKSDTIFIKANDNTHCFIFIDKNKRSEYYKQISNFSFNSFDSATYKEAINLLKSNSKARFSEYRINDFAKEWVPLYVYKNKFYVYAPSDWGYNNWIKITDSTLIEHDMEGPAPSKIKSFKKINQQQVELTILGAQQKQRRIKVYIINPKYQTAVFEFSGKHKKTEYKLMVSVNKINHFPVIVNYCKDSKVQEMEFEKPNFKKLIKQL